MELNINSALSSHAALRCQQRGIRGNMIRTLLEWHDIDADVGSGCRALRVSDDVARKLQAVGSCAQNSERIRRLVVIWSDRSNQVVTAFHDNGGRQSRRYRNGR